MNAIEYREPFRHWIIEVDSATISDAFREIPGHDWPGWEARYENDCERHKRTCREPARIGPACVRIFRNLNSAAKVHRLETLTGLCGLQADPTLHGAGIHVTDPGGWLNPHLDYAIHPTSGLERRLNLVLFLNPLWQESWGGAFELCDELGKPVKWIYPTGGRAVLWEPTDLAYHGTQQVVVDAPPRVTAAVYYLAPPRPGVTRKRALFIPKRG